MTQQQSKLELENSSEENPIRQRFERDFLPRFGPMWRSMLASMDDEEIQQNLQPYSSSSIPTMQKNEEENMQQQSVPSPPPSDFLQAIQQKSTICIQVPQVHHPSNDGSTDNNCECLDCTPPILEFENNEIQEEGSNKIDRDDSEKENRLVGTHTMGTPSSAFSTSSHSSSSDEYTDAPTTPLPHDLEQVFGALSLFGDEHSQRDVADGGDTTNIPNKTGTTMNTGTDLTNVSSHSHGTKDKNSRSIVSPEANKNPFIVDLVDSESESDTDNENIQQSLRQQKIAMKPTTSDKSESILVDTSSDEEKDNGMKSFGKRSLRKVARPRYIEESSSSDDSDDSRYLDFQSPERDDRKSHRLSLSKLAKTPTSNESRDAENLNPNVQAATSTKKTSGAFKKNREVLSKKIFEDYNFKAFNGELSSVDVVWSNKLRTTAGLTRLKRYRKDFTPGAPPTRLATIELSVKVLDDESRLQSTLLHEMCHAAAWLIDGVSKPPHGPCFKKHAKVAMRKIPGSEVTTTHDYAIQYKYAWACSKDGCNFVVKRHSRSINTDRQCCGRCRGRLIEIDASKLNNVNSVGDLRQSNILKTPKKKAPPSGYNLFIKNYSSSVRERMQKQSGNRREKVSQGDVLKECARLWREQKNNSATTTIIE